MFILTGNISLSQSHSSLSVCSTISGVGNITSVIPIKGNISPGHSNRRVIFRFLFQYGQYFVQLLKHFNVSGKSHEIRFFISRAKTFASLVLLARLTNVITASDDLDVVAAPR